MYASFWTSSTSMMASTVRGVAIAVDGIDCFEEILIRGFADVLDFVFDLNLEGVAVDMEATTSMREVEGTFPSST